MSTDPTPEEVVQPEATELDLAYQGASQLVASDDQARLALTGNLKREPIRFEAAIRDPLRFREAMSALYAVVASDFRYVPKDRTAYLAYKQLKREAAGMALWQAQQAYFSWLLRNDPLAFVLLDPIVSVHPDRVFFEVFSKDEGTYAHLAFDHAGFQAEGEHQFGTTNIDFSQALFDGVQQMRSYRATQLSIGREAVSMATTAQGEVVEKKVRVPDTWLRGFLQVQSATTLPSDSFRLAPLDLYNVLRHLRMNADQKGKRRGIRVELLPGEKPRLVLEPWETVIVGQADTYRGKTAKVVRIWGRRRLALLRRLLPFLDQVEIHVLGSGLPSFWVFRASDFTFTLGLTGFTSANWSQAVNFDLLLPRKARSTKSLDEVIKHLSRVWFASPSELTQATGLKGENLLEAVQLGCQQGRLMFDLAHGVYRLRPLLERPPELERLEFRNRRDRVAHDLIARRNAVAVVSLNRIPGVGLEVTGKVTVSEDKREYRPQLLLGDEGQVSKAECTCPLFRQQGLKDGPCAHLIALRLAHAEDEAERQRSGTARQTVTVETRVFTKRQGELEEVIQLSLERQRLKVRYGKSGQDPRLQSLRYNSTDEARVAYFARVDDLQSRGFLDATAS